MPIVALADITIRNLKPTPGKQIIYVDRNLKGFGVRVSEHGQMFYVLTFGANRQRIKLGEVGVVKLAETRNILAERLLELMLREPSTVPRREHVGITVERCDEPVLPYEHGRTTAAGRERTYTLTVVNRHRR